jgi:signal transduction histidine kinase
MQKRTPGSANQLLCKMLLINPPNAYTIPNEGMYWEYPFIIIILSPIMENIKAKILLVDDEPILVAPVRLALEAALYEVSVAVNCEMAIKAAESAKPDIILLDIVMPGINGYETCKRLKLNSNTKDIPVIFLTMHSETFDKVHAFQSGASDFILKSVDINELLARIETHITLYRLKRELNDLNDTLEERVKRQTEELVRANESLKKEIEERKSAERQVRDLSRDLVLSQDDERRRIARDLHDSVTQTLLAAKIKLLEFDEKPDKNKDLFNHVVSFLDRALQELKEIYGNLYPAMLHDLGLSAAVKWYSKHQLEMNKISVLMDLDIHEDASEEIKLNFYRIIQELFSNIARHSGADSVTVVFHLIDENNITLVVEDTGIGFNPHEGSGIGLGLSTIRQRCDHIGCSLEIESKEGSGVRISIRKKSIE